MNKLIFILFLNTYVLCGFSTDIETDPIKAFDSLKIKYPIIPQEGTPEKEVFHNELTKIAGLFDLTKEVNNKIIDLLDKMTVQEIEEFDFSMFEAFHEYKGKNRIERRKTHNAYIEVIKQSCKKRLTSFLKDFTGLDTFDFSSPQLNELIFLVNMAPKEEHSLFSKKNINSILNAIVNLSYDDFSKNLHIVDLLKEVSKGLKEHYYRPKSRFMILYEQARFKLSYLIKDDHDYHRRCFEPIVQSDLINKSFYWDQKTPTFDIIYNNDGYSNIEYEKFTKGNHVRDINNPIGYVIFTPKTEIKNIIIDIYGGWQKTDISTRLNVPIDYLTDFKKSILNNETVLIELNLPDLLKNDSYQGKMNLELLTQIHEAVDHFHTILKNNPTEIHNSLEALKDKPIFLMGSSFGGMMSVYHAINYPGTFTGYISHAGSLYGPHYNPNNLGYDFKVAVIAKIKKIQEPVFIHHSLDDNRVNVKTSLEFYRLAKLAKKERLIKLFIDDHGSRVNQKEPGLHGHFFPQNYYLKVSSEQFIDFINSNGKNIEPILNEWRYKKFTKISHRLDGLGSYVHKNQKRDLHKVLLSKGLTYYNDLRKSGNKDDFEKLWSKQITPYLWKISLEESLRPKSYFDDKNANFAAFNMRQEFKNLFRPSETELKNIVKIMLKDDISIRSVITDEFINNVLQDIKDWLNDEREHEKDSSLNEANKAFLSIMFNINEKIPNAVETFNNTKLKEDLLNAIKEQRQKALKIIYDKIAKDPKKVKELIETN